MQQSNELNESNELDASPELPGVLLHHSISAVHNDEFCQELRSHIEQSVPTETPIGVATTPNEFASNVGDAEIVLTNRPFGDKLPVQPTLNWVQTLNSGVDFYDLDRLSEMSITVTNAAGVAANPIAEQVLGYLITFERKIDHGIRQQENRGVWQKYSGGELSGKTVGIIGVGAIGTRVAELATAFGMDVLGTKRTPETAPDVVDEIYPPSDLDDVLRRSDYVVISCPLVESTYGLIDEEELMSMKSDAILVNVGRGEIINEQSLEIALQQDRIRGAALDVFETEPLSPESILWDLPNVIITPHMAGSTPKYAERVGKLFADNYSKYLNDQQLSNQVI